MKIIKLFREKLSERESARDNPEKSRNFSDPFRVRQLPLCLRNAEVLSHQTLQSSWFFLHKNTLKDKLFKTRGLQFDNWLGTLEKQAPGIRSTHLVALRLSNELSVILQTYIYGVS